MNSYRLVLVAEGSLPERTGYVFCADDEAAKEAARSLLRGNQGHVSVLIYQDGRRVGEIVR